LKTNIYMGKTSYNETSNQWTTMMRLKNQWFLSVTRDHLQGGDINCIIPHKQRMIISIIDLTSKMILKTLHMLKACLIHQQNWTIDKKICKIISGTSGRIMSQFGFHNRSPIPWRLDLVNFLSLDVSFSINIPWL
jgi:hypothetical protein